MRFLRRPTPEARKAAAEFTARTGYYAKAVGGRVEVSFSVEATNYVAGLLDDRYNVDTHEP